MIKLSSKEDCCGCYACVATCPVSCISMQPDEEGFLYPVTDEDACIACGLCQKACPVIHTSDSRKTLGVYAVKNKEDEIREKSSSGGVFSLLAERMIAEGGIVFGACFNDKNEVIHTYAATQEELAVFRGSKYVQSKIGNTYRLAEEFLQSGRRVLFSGTPCQILGLHRYLKKTYPNLLTVDFICHGVPSPGVWQIYLQELRRKLSVEIIQNISFRDKKLGWKNFSFSFDSSKKDKILHYVAPKYLNHYMRGFLSDLYLRPICYQCPVRSLKSGSDITLGDFWGADRVLPEFCDDKGISAVLINSSVGMIYFNTLSCEKKISSYEEVIKGNHSLETSHVKPAERAQFYSRFKKESFFSLIEDLTRMSWKDRLKLKIINFLFRVEKYK